MSVRILSRHAVTGLLIGTAMAATARGQIFYPYSVRPGIGLYPRGGGLYYGPYLYDYPGTSYHAVPYPPGGYLPNQPLPPLRYAVPYRGLVPQPYPYSYQPPLYAPRPYLGPSYPPGVTPPYYYRYRRPYAYPRSAPRQSHGYRATPGQRQNVAPVGSDSSLDDTEDLPAGPRMETP